MRPNVLAPLLATTLAALTGFASAHEADALLPEAPGIAVGLSGGGGWLHGDRALPAPRLTGVTSLGDTPGDARGWQLEHATAGVGIRFLPRLAGALSVGRHADGETHVEAAWLQVELNDPLSELSGDPGLIVGAGRNRLPLGPVIETAGHLDRYAEMPLAKRAAFNGDWIDDGLNLRWQPHADGWLAWLDTVDVGAWRARRFPGAGDGPLAPLVHLRARWDNFALDGFVTRLKPEGRGAYVQRDGSGHVHTAPRCDAGLANIVCLDGRVDLVGGSVDWATPLSGLRLQAAIIHRRERGELYSQNGSTRYRGRSTGGWIELLWVANPLRELGLRHEWLQGNNDVAGIGATRVVTDANLLPYNPARRTMATIGWRPHPDWRLGLEAGRERIAGDNATIIAVRAVWTPRPRVVATW